MINLLSACKILNKNLTVFILVFLTGLHTTAQAAQCNLQLSESVLDYGTISQSFLIERKNPSEKSLLAKRLLTLTATCKNEALISIEFIDASKGDVKRMDSVIYRVVGARLDGKPVQLSSIEAPERGIVSILNSGEIIHPSTSALGKELSIQLEIQPELDAKLMRETRTDHWESFSTFKIHNN